MGLKETLKNLFSSHKDEDVNHTFETLLDALIKEAYKHNPNSYWMSSSLGKLKAYATIKALDVTTKKDLLFYLIAPINKYETLSKKSGSYQGREHIFQKSYTYSELCTLLMRSNLEFTTDEIMTLLNAFKTADQSHQKNFVNWPVGFAMQQVERIVKKSGLDAKLKAYLEAMLKWPQLKQTTSYWGTDLEKVRVKIEKILFESENEEGKMVPYTLPEDRMAAVINPQIAGLNDDAQNYWYALFHMFIKATGSKPTKKFLKESSGFIDGIGQAKYKAVVHEWLELVSSLKTIETTKQHKYAGGEVYNYLSHEFLHEKNLIFVKGLMWSMSKFYDSKTLELIAKLAERAFEKIPGVGPTAAGVGNACLYTLGNTRGLEGISHLSRLKLRIRQNNTKKIIENYIDVASEKLGVSASEIEELSIPDFGLDKGIKHYAFDEYTLEIKIEAIGKVLQTWIKPDGSVQKTTPSFIKATEKHKKTLKKAKDQVAQIKKYLTAQRDRIDRLYLHERVWSYEDFLKQYLNHGLVHFIAKDLIWNFKTKGKSASAIWTGKDWQDADGNTLDWIDAQVEVRLWHPIHSTTNDVLDWRNRLDALQRKQALKQAYREVYILTDAEITTKSYSNRMAAHILKQHQFNALTAVRGWKYSLLGAYDDGRDGELAKIALKQQGLEAQFWINEINADDAYNDAGIWNYVATDQVRFVNADQEAVDLIEIPKLILSEILRDVDLFVGVASVGNDPEWRDNGGLPQYTDYWTSYSFGDLTEVAKTRKEILEKLVPRLKINKVASFEGKFLKIKGKKRVYKIHIGSSNILMEPNDQYLCIVPSRGKDANLDKVFLPFEGDRGLSLVLSKAFLLAEDDKITDTTILSQINR